MKCLLLLPCPQAKKRAKQGGKKRSIHPPPPLPGCTLRCDSLKGGLSAVVVVVIITIISSVVVFTQSLNTYI